MALVVVVLIIAAVNVASVTLARGLARQPELATRRALGAGPMRLLGHLFAENAVIVMAGTLLGVVLAVLMASLIARIHHPELPDGRGRRRADAAHRCIRRRHHAAAVAGGRGVAGLSPRSAARRAASHDAVGE